MLDKLQSYFRNYQDKTYYPHQRRAIQWAIESDYNHLCLIAPTGSGKSWIGMSIALAQTLGASEEQEGQVLYLCSSKILQTQLQEDFPEVQTMWGRSNFECLRHRGFTCSDCPIMVENAHKPSSAKRKPKCPDCHYENKKRAVLAAPFQILNYAYFLTEANYVGKFSNYPIIIADEADAIEKHLRSIVTIDFSQKMSQRLNLGFPERKTASASGAISMWKTWGENAKNRIGIRLREISDKLTGIDEDQVTPYHIRISRESDYLKGAMGKLKIFTEHVDETWIYQSVKGGHRFQPIWLPPELTNQYFFRHAKRFLQMSATFPPKLILAKLLGLEIEDISTMEVPSSFPIDHRKIELKNAADMRRKTLERDMPKLQNAIRAILAAHPNEKGIIHTVSYSLMEKVLEVNNERLMGHNPTNKVEALSKFMKSDHPLVFVSPSSTRGLDLHGDLARFNIIAKMPYQSLGDKLVAARAHSSGQIGKRWYLSDAAQELVQAAGRTTRNMSDWSKVYVIDIAANNLIVGDKELWPEYFLEAVDISFEEF